MRLPSMSVNTIGAVDNLVGDLLRQPLAAALVYDHLGPLPRQTIEIEYRHMRTANPGWRELWTKGDDHQHPKRVYPVNQQIEQRSRCRIAPVCFLDYPPVVARLVPRPGPRRSLAACSSCAISR
jgi:hypothetical protein